MSGKKAIIIGAGPAGLTAAYELLTRTDVKPIVLEVEDYLGGISRTANYKGNHIDIGGHRFFSKSDRVMDWWRAQMPIEHTQGDQPDPKTTDHVMLVRHRKSRIYFLRKFFDYPLRFNGATLANLGPVRIFKMGTSYVWAMLTGKKQPKNLEEFFISRFGRELYLTFFKSYTEKVWGEKCSNISADWGAQRVKGLSIVTAIIHFVKSLFQSKAKDISQKDTETSLIEQFLYPKFGPGQMWEAVAKEVTARGGTILLKHRATRLHTDADRITAVEVTNLETGEKQTLEGDYVFSTMPVKELIGALDADVPANVKEVTDGLMYRDFITVGLLVKKLKVTEPGPDGKPRPVTDNWIYIQEPDVTVGRLQLFNNWSPYMVSDPQKMWVGMEFFCYETDPVWTKPDDEMIALAKGELAKIGIIDAADVVDATVIHMKKTYPAYFGTYDRFDEIRKYVDGYVNLYLVGRNGMHRYNNQDHSMLTAMTAVDNIAAGQTDKANIWDVNTEQDYHEAKENVKKYA